MEGLPLSEKDETFSKEIQKGFFQKVLRRIFSATFCQLDNSCRAKLLKINLSFNC